MKKRGMFIISILSISSLFLACGGQDRDKKSGREPKSQISEQVFKNIIQGDISLLSAKYEIAEDRLINIIVDYEKITMGFSQTALLMQWEKKPSVTFKDVVNVATALNILSEKYGISKKVLASMILEKSIVERNSGANTG